MGIVTIEVDINAAGKVTVNPNPAVAADGDIVTWHVSSNKKGKGNVRVDLPRPNSPFDPDSVNPPNIYALKDPEVCQSFGSADPIKWPPGVESYSYQVSFSQSPPLSLITALLTKRSTYSLEPLESAVVNNYHFDEEQPSSVINNYYFGRGTRQGGYTSMTRSRVHLENCVAYRVWRNQSNANKDRTVGVYPSSGSFPAGSQVTVFVAPDGHTGAPTPAMNPTTVSDQGDSVAKTVPSGSAIFVHYKGTGSTNRVDADITEES